MGQKLPKTLLDLGGKPMVSYGARALLDLGLKELVAVVGTKARQVGKAISREAESHPAPKTKIRLVRQKTLSGTADAARLALEAVFKDYPKASATSQTGTSKNDSIKGEDSVNQAEDMQSACFIVLPADVPLIRVETLQKLIHIHQSSKAAAVVLTAEVDNPAGYGRILRDPDKKLRGIVEHKDASPEELALNEICTSIYCFSPLELAKALKSVAPSSVSGEYYLTDVVGILIESGHLVESYKAPDSDEVLGVNTPEQLEEVSNRL